MSHFSHRAIRKVASFLIALYLAPCSFDVVVKKLESRVATYQNRLGWRLSKGGLASQGTQDIKCAENTDDVAKWVGHEDTVDTVIGHEFGHDFER